MQEPFQFTIMYLLSVMVAVWTYPPQPSSLGTTQVYTPEGEKASFPRLSLTCSLKPLLVKSLLGDPLPRGTMLPLGYNHSPTLPPSLSRQHRELRSEVTQTREESGKKGPVPGSNAPTFVIRMVELSGYVSPFSRKYSEPSTSERKDCAILKVPFTRIQPRFAFPST